MWKISTIAAAVVVLLAFLCNWWYVQQNTIILKEDLRQRYDFIVVGGGAAGSAVAARLSELPNVTVLVLEAGHNDQDFPDTQWLSSEQRLQTGDFDWKYRTVPQKNCCDSLNNKVSAWPRAKGLGGCTSHFGAAHMRGSRYDYELWNNEFDGQGGWGFHDVFPYFKKMENVELIEELKSNPKLRQLHGFDGPQVLTHTPLSTLGQVYLDVVKRKGYPWKDDVNSMGEEDDQEGFSHIQFARRGDGRRMSTSAGYLHPAALLRPTQLHILTRAQVTKLLFQSDNGVPVATGVQFVHDVTVHTVYANAEVIVSGGAINSPQLLMLSGIGPKDQLEEHGIEVLVDNPAVGENMYDHMLTYLTGTVNESVGYQSVNADDPIDFALAKLKYYLMANGPLANTPIDWTAFIRSGVTKEVWPDLQLYLVSAHSIHPAGVFNLNQQASESIWPDGVLNEGRYAFGLVSILLHPHNTGNIRLCSSDPFDHPLIDPKYLQNNIDVDILAKGLKIVMDLTNSTELKKYDIKIVNKHAPGCEMYELFSDEYLKCHTRSTLLTIYHPVGTCRMGKKGQNSVVDNRLRVHGVRNLRVVDASVFPYQVSANTYAPTVMVAEKGADMIKEDLSMARKVWLC